MKDNAHRFRLLHAATRLTTVFLLLVTSAFLVGSQATSVKHDVIDGLENMPGGVAQRGVPMLGGTWDVTVTSSYAYEYGWEITRGRSTSTIAWRIKQTLIETNDPNRQQLKGQTSDDSYFEFRDGVIEYNRSRTVYSFSQWAACEVKENSFSCKGTQNEFGRTQPIKIEGTRTGTPPREENPAGTKSAPSVEILEVVGEVEISPGGDDSQAYRIIPGTRIRSGDRIVTGMDSRARIRFPDGHIAEVGELTDMKVAAFSDAGSLLATRLYLRGGRVSCEVNKESERPSTFEVKTPTNGGRRGHHAQETGLEVKALPRPESHTRFTVNYAQQSGVTRIVVAEGRVLITPLHSQSFHLTSNQQVAVSPGAKVGPITSTATRDPLSPQGASGRAPTLPATTGPVQPGSVPPLADIGGPWVTSTGDVITLTQNGNRVTGTYRGAPGTGAISGTFDGRMLTGTLEIEQIGIRVSQRLTLRLTDGRLEGTLATPLSTINLILSRPTN